MTTKNNAVKTVYIVRLANQAVTAAKPEPVEESKQMFLEEVMEEKIIFTISEMILDLLCMSLWKIRGKRSERIRTNKEELFLDLDVKEENEQDDDDNNKELTD